MAQIIKHSEFNPTLITVNGLRRYGKGGKFCPVSYGPNNQAINLQTPVNLSCPFGVSVWDNNGEKSSSIEVSFQDLRTDPRMKKFYTTMLELDEYILDKAAENSLAWFGKPLTREVLAGLYRPLVKPPKDPKYCPTMKIKIPALRGGVQAYEVYSENKEKVGLECITKGCSLRCVLELRPVWFVNKQFGLTWHLVQAHITGRAPQRLGGEYAFIEEED